MKLEAHKRLLADKEVKSDTQSLYITPSEHNHDDPTLPSGVDADPDVKAISSVAAVARLRASK